jgi:CheY-like chemotaxis protein
VRVASSSPNLDVLLADSSAYWRRSVRDMLRRAGATRCREACDGAEALGAIEDKAPDLLILDWRLPVVGAGEIMRLLRLPSGGGTEPAVPIIVTMSDPMRADVDEVLALGASEILAKPFSTSALLARFEEAVCRPRELVQVAGRWRPAPRLNMAA